jgi:hypothetical protein
MASNTILTPTMITREALRVLHQKSNFLGACNRQYDSQFARSGAKIGTSLNVRMPAKFTTRTNATLAAQNYVERSTPLTVSSQYGVDVSFTTVDLTMSMDDFSKRFIDPAMAQLAATIESAAMTQAYKLINNYTGTTSTSLTYLTFAQGGQKITENLGPQSPRTAVLNPLSRVNFSDAVKGLFQDSQNIKEAYREGTMGRTGGFNCFENTLNPTHTMGTLAGTVLTDGAALGTSTTATEWVSQTVMQIDGATSLTTLKAGDIITFGTVAAGLVACQPESKTSYGRLMPFVVQSDVTFTTLADDYSVTVKPGVMYGVGNAYQNCILTKADTDGMTVTLFGAASSVVGQNFQFHEDAFVFATADLEDVSQYGAWGARESLDGISMRIARQYAIASDTVPCRIDVLWGFAGLYPELAVRNIHTLA